MDPNNISAFLLTSLSAGDGLTATESLISHSCHSTALAPLRYTALHWLITSSQSHIATGRQSVSKSWCRAPDIYYCLTVTALFLWDALSDERTGLSFVYAAGSCQHNLSQVWVPWYSQPYFTDSDLRLPFSSPPTTCRVTVEVFDPASTRVYTDYFNLVGLVI
jgi:hypothetical protein